MARGRRTGGAADRDDDSGRRSVKGLNAPLDELIDATDTAADAIGLELP